jgi:putative nucleotidyltransferase with HDIG domain
MESRDPYTAGHQKKVALISEAISRKMGWDDQRVQGLFLAGLVHDIGKIAIPAEILTKPSKLTEIEATLMRQHPNTGYEILKDIPFTWPLAKAVQQHHERLDGSGYPNGLKGDQIIPEALILAVADTLESMSSHRPYRPGLGIDKTLEYINQESGKTFDATIVNVVNELVRQKDFQLILGLP